MAPASKNRSEATLEDAGYLTNETVFNMTERPARLGVIGSGPIGCELAQTFQRLDSQVILVHRGTHAADFLARTVLANALFMGRQKASALTIPWCTYTDPQIAHAGIIEQQAATQGIPLDTYKLPLADVDRAVLDGEGGLLVTEEMLQGFDFSLTCLEVLPAKERARGKY